MRNLYIIDHNSELRNAVPKLNRKLLFCHEDTITDALDNDDNAIVLLHHAVVGLTGTEVIERIASHHPSANIIVVGERLTETQILAYLLAGAIGYQDISGLNKYCDKMLCVVSAGEAWITRTLTAALIKQYRQSPTIEPV